MGSAAVLLKVFLPKSRSQTSSFLTVLMLSDTTFKSAFAQSMRNKPGQSCTWATNTICWQDHAFSAAEKCMLFGSFSILGYFAALQKMFLLQKWALSGFLPG